MLAIKINPETGMRVAEGGIVDYFYQEFVPPEESAAGGMPIGGERAPEEIRNQLF